MARRTLTIVVDRWLGGRLASLQSSQCPHRLSTHLFPDTLHFSVSTMYQEICEVQRSRAFLRTWWGWGNPWTVPQSGTKTQDGHQFECQLSLSSTGSLSNYLNL